MQHGIFWVEQKPIVVSDYCDYSTFVIIAQKIKIKCTLVIIAQKGHFTAQKCALLEHKKCTSVIISFLRTLQHKIRFVRAQKVHFRDCSTKKILSFRFAKMVKRQYLIKYFIFQLANCSGLKSVKQTSLLDA